MKGPIEENRREGGCFGVEGSVGLSHVKSKEQKLDFRM